MLRIFCFIFVILLVICSSCNQEKGKNSAITPKSIQKQSNPKIDYEGISAMNPDSSINMIVEISAGTTAKYEMNKHSHQIVMDSINGKPRYVNYLGYPGNYGLIPNTILPKSEGGDGDPLDILLLGMTKSKGTVQKVRIIGVMKLLDNKEQDDKILAVPLTKKWSKVHNIEDLDLYFPGARDIVSIFFTNYKAKGEMEFVSWEDRAEAMEVVNKAHANSSPK